MSYKIAVGSSDGVNVDLKFGEVNKFLIYDIDDDIRFVGARKVDKRSLDNTVKADVSANCNSGCSSDNSCGNRGNGCGGEEGVLKLISTIKDCRCVVCKKVGFQAQKQFEKKAIAVFDVEMPIKEALDKIASYYKKIDHHQSLRK